MSNHHRPTTTEESTPPPDDSSFIIHDNSSEISRTKIFPDNFIEPLVILARIKGYKGIDDYVIHLIENELESIRDGGQGISDLGEYVIKYIARIIGPDDTTTILTNQTS
ncbi:MAG: hypothetical protein ACR2F1_15675 [Nitrososphaeraceae archaeon]